MSCTSKAINTERADGHLMRKGDLARDSIKQLKEFINPMRLKAGLPELEVPKLQVDDTISDYEEGDQLGVERGELILEQRLYFRDADGKVIGEAHDGDECVAAHSRIRREREAYRDLDGRLVQAGKVASIRKGKYMDTPRGKKMRPRQIKERKASGVLKSIMVRLMPHEGEIAGRHLTLEDLAKAMDLTVENLEEAVGCEAVSAVAHRMRNRDCHLHIQFTMIKPYVETAWKLGKILKPWREKAAAMARSSLAEEKVLNPGPSAIGARKRALIASKELEPEPVAGIEFRKISGKRSLQQDAILGYSFRHKLNLVRLAEEGGDPALADRVICRKDGPGRFRTIATADDKDLEDRYLDLWLERIWRGAIKDRLPPEIVTEMASAGMAAAVDYATFGTTSVEEKHLKDRKDELEEIGKKALLDIDTAENARELAESAARRADEAAREAEVGIAELATRQAEFDARAEAWETEVAQLQADIEADRRKAVAELAAAGMARTRAEDAARKQAETSLAAAKREEAEAELRGFQRVFAKLFPGKKAKAETVVEIERELESGIVGIRQEAEIGAWANVLKFFGRSEVSKDATVETLAQDVNRAIVGRIVAGLAAGVANVFRIFGREAPTVKTQADANTVLADAAEAYTADARRDGLALAVSRIRGVEVSAVGEMDPAALTSEIEREAVKLREGLVAPTWSATNSLAQYVFGGSMAKVLKGGNQIVQEMRNLLKGEFDRRGKAEVELEKA
ncbi:MAG: hypothetical protein WCS52_19425, partial [bacterium]